MTTEAVRCGVEVVIPLKKLKKFPENAWKIPDGQAAIEALAASIEHKSVLQNLVVQPQVRVDGSATGNTLEIASLGRRLSQGAGCPTSDRAVTPLRMLTGAAGFAAIGSITDGVVTGTIAP